MVYNGIVEKESNEMKVYDYNAYGNNYKAFLEKGNYTSNGTLAIQMYVEEEGFAMPWAMLTVNLTDKGATKDKAYIDTNNLGIEILEWLEVNGIATNTGKIGFSGFCVYPLYQFNKEVLDTMETMK